MAEGPESEPDEFGRWTSEVDEDKPDETDPTGPIREYFLWDEFREGDFGDGANAVCITLFLILAVVVVFSAGVLVNKPGRPPFGERSALLSVLTALSGLTWAWATLVVDEHAPAWLLGGQTDAALWLCWLRTVLGFGLWSSCLVTRLQAMNKIYIHDEEPLPAPLKLLQYFSLWLLAALMLVLPADPAITLFSATFFVTALHGFYAAFVAAPLIQLRKSVPDFMATVVGLLAGFSNNLWLALALEDERDHGSAKHPLRDDGARKFLGTFVTLAVVLVHWLWSHGPLLFHHCKGDEEFLARYEPGTKKPAKNREAKTGIRPNERLVLPEEEPVDALVELPDARTRRESELGPVGAAFEDSGGCAARLLGRCCRGAGSRYKLNKVPAGL